MSSTLVDALFDLHVAWILPEKMGEMPGAPSCGSVSLWKDNQLLTLRRSSRDGVTGIHRGGSDHLGYSQGHEEQGPSQPYLIPLVKVPGKGGSKWQALEMGEGRAGNGGVLPSPCWPQWNVPTAG